TTVPPNLDRSPDFQDAVVFPRPGLSLLQVLAAPSIDRMLSDALRNFVRLPLASRQPQPLLEATPQLKSTSGQGRVAPQRKAATAHMEDGGGRISHKTCRL